MSYVDRTRLHHSLTQASVILSFSGYLQRLDRMCSCVPCHTMFFEEELREKTINLQQAGAIQFDIIFIETQKAIVAMLREL